MTAVAPFGYVKITNSQELYLSLRSLSRGAEMCAHFISALPSDDPIAADRLIDVMRASIENLSAQAKTRWLEEMGKVKNGEVSDDGA